MRSRTGGGGISLPAFACCRVIIEYLDCCVREFDKANPLCLQGGYRLPNGAPPFSLAVRGGDPGFVLLGPSSPREWSPLASDR